MEDDGNDDQPGCRGGRPKGERSGTRARPRRADVPPPALAEAPAKRKREAVLRLLRGEDLEVVSRQLGVTAATLSEWRESFLAAGEAALISRPADERDRQIERLKAKVGDLTLSNELLEAKIDHLEAHRPVARRRSRR